MRARWSNYGACVSFAVPGENIFSTSVSVFNKESGVDYDTASGTSFSAPMIAGIIALGYNKYGYISPDTVYMSLNESMEINKAGNYVVNAKKYLDILEKKKAQIQKEQQEFEKNGKVTPSENKKGETILSDTEFLQNKGVIDNKKYILSELVGRFEVVSIAMKILNIYLPPSYTCRGMYMDISGSKNTLMCQIVEMATEKGLVTVK